MHLIISIVETVTTILQNNARKVKMKNKGTSLEFERKLKIRVLNFNFNQWYLLNCHVEISKLSKNYENIFLSMKIVFEEHWKNRPDAHTRVWRVPGWPFSGWMAGEGRAWLCKIKDPAMVIPLRLTKGACAVYQRLGDEATIKQIK